MIKTESQVEQDFYDALKKTSLIGKVSGKLYKYGLRPFDSKGEDIVIRITTLNANQLQEGVATILVFIKNIDGAEVGRMTPDKNRIAIVEGYCLECLEELKRVMEEYGNLRLETSIVSKYDAELKQSFVSTRIKFSYLTI